MSIFNEVIAGFIGFLVVVLGGGEVDVSARGDADVMATSSITLEDRGFIEELRDSLIHLQARLQTSSEFSSDVEEDRGREDEDRGRDAEGEKARGEDGDDDIADASDDFNEDEMEDEDEDDHRGSGAQSGAGASGSSGSGSSASGSVSGALATLTMSEIAKHNSSASCFTSIDGSVYDLTKWIPQHPGGEAAIKGLCGVDGTAAFNGQHGGAAKQAQILAGFKIGVVAK